VSRSMTSLPAHAGERALLSSFYERGVENAGSGPGL
jgi:hypothetical protein